MLKSSAIRFCCLLAIVATVVVGQDRSIHGRVYGPSGQPIERSVRVEIQGPRGFMQTVDTGSTGLFSFRTEVLGEYTATVDAGEEFEPATQSILVDALLLKAVSLSDGNSTRVNIYLKPKARDVTRAQTLDAKLASLPKNALDHYGKGLKLASANKFAEAAVELQKAKQAHPGFYQAQTELGKVYLKLSRFDEAAAAFRASLEKEPNNFAARFNLGIALLNQKKFDEALPEFVLAADLDKTDSSPHYYVGVIKYETGDADAAIAAFEKAKELNVDKPFPMLHKYLASLYLKKAKWALAVAALETYLAQSPNAQDAEKIRVTIAEAQAKIK